MAENAFVPPTPSGKELPEKYIRTFAGDMETLHQGKAPDLVSLESPSPAADERPAGVSLPPAPEAPPVQVVPPTSLEQAPIPVPQSPRPSLTASLKTYSDDFRDRLKEKHASTATVLAAEQDSAPRPREGVDEKPARSGLLYVIAGVVLLIAGAAGAYVAYERYTAARAPVAAPPGVAAPIFVDERQEVGGTGAALLQAVAQSVARDLSPNTVRLLSFTGTSATESVFSQLPLSAPLVLVRNIQAAGSMAGIVNVEGFQTPFFILSVSSYSNTFAGMLAWETLMQRDLGALFPAYPPRFVATTTTAAGQATTTMVLVANTKPGFYDEVVSNHDVRVYRDAAGRVLLLYGYWNQSTLVIARDPAAFAEVLERLANSRTAQ